MVRVLPYLLLAIAASVIGCSQSDPLEDIRKLQADGKFKETVQPLRAILEESPEKSEANFLLGRALLLVGQPGLAIWPLRKATEDSEYAIKSGLLLTRATLSSRFKSEAVRAATDVLAIEPENLPALGMRIEAYIGTSEYEKALVDIEKAQELDPESTEAQVQKVMALLALERVEEAKEALELATEKMDSAAEEDVPQRTRARLCIVSGLFAFERGEQEQAEAQYAQCLEQFPTEPIVVLESVRLYDGMGQRDKATEILKNAYEQAPSSEFRRGLAQRMAALKDSEESGRLLREEAEQSNTLMAWFELADFHVQRDEFDLALPAFEKALEVSPNVPDLVRFAYADTLIVAGKSDQARRVADQLNNAALQSLIEGRARLSEGNPRGALESFEAGLRLWPNNAGGRFLAGQAAEQIGDFDRAESEYRESIRADGGDTEAALYLARLMEAQGAYASALDMVGMYVRRHRAEPSGYIYSIRLANRLGRREIVTEGLQRLSRLPEQTGVAVALRAELIGDRLGADEIVKDIEKTKLDLDAPANTPALSIFVDKLGELGRHAQARERVSKTLELHPESPEIHVIHARVLQADGAPLPQIRDAYRKAIDLDPENAEALAALAGLEAKAGNEAVALSLYERADATDPDEPDSAIAAFELARASATPPEREARLVELLRRYPHSAWAAGELAMIVATDGKDMKRALDLARRAGQFGARPYEQSRRALRAVEASGVSPQAEEARDLIARLDRADNK